MDAFGDLPIFMDTLPRIYTRFTVFVVYENLKIKYFLATLIENYLFSIPLKIPN